jgi:hypothetical protein
MSVDTAWTPSSEVTAGTEIPVKVFLRPYRGYGDITQVTWDGTSNYNSLQVQVNRRYIHGVQFGAAYTLQRARGYADEDPGNLSTQKWPF